MAHFKPRAHKQSEDGDQVTLYQDTSGGWFVGKPGEVDTDPIPMGAFIDEQAARAWADRRFPGGSWR